MKRLLSVALFIVFLPLLAMAQSDFDGTWKVDLTKSTMFIPSAAKWSMTCRDCGFSVCRQNVS
jgi:hypothetical protein